MDHIADQVSATMHRYAVKGSQDESKLRIRRYRRERLLRLRLAISKCLFIFSLGSILIMVVNNQLVISDIYTACSKPSLAMKTAITSFTGLLILFLWIYNYVQLAIFGNLRNISSFYNVLLVNPHRIVFTFLETLATIPHTFPVCVGYKTPWKQTLVSEHMTIDEMLSSTMASNVTTIGFTKNGDEDLVEKTFFGKEIKISQIDAVLSIVMLVRVYQVARFVVLHSRLFRTMLSYSLGALTQTKYNFTFIFKSYMAIYKGYFLGLVALMCTTTAAWCIYISDKKISQFTNSLWVVYITFFTVGKLTAFFL